MTKPRATVQKTVGVVGATAIGIGGMMGAGLYTLVGLATASAGKWLPIAFIIGGLVASFSVYSYSKLGAKYPSKGGAAQFLLTCFGDGMIAGGLNVFQYFGWIVAMALYAAGFAEYACDLTGLPQNSWISKGISVGIILVIVVINLLGSKQVARAQTLIVSFELLILLIFIIGGLLKAHVPTTTSGSSDSGLGIISAAGLLYVTYEGFGVVTNAAGSMKDPQHELPRAMYLSLGLVLILYVIISTLVIATIGTNGAIANQGHALAAAGRSVLGPVGHIGVGLAALVATASAVNSTMFGDENLGLRIAKVGELPHQFGVMTKVGGPWGLFVTALLTCCFVVAFPLSAVGEMASLAFLLVYATVNIGHLKVYKQTGARRCILWVAIILNLILFAFLFIQTIFKGETMTWASVIVMLIISFVAEWLWQRHQHT
ncbi:APC family permease [Limosilactobacillus caecicola]|uniref:APC family permease n=1 Tax=Limosilactobacillus caecicola TaxID=2941332 RepID=UPI00203E8AA2|nr:APC family permease [Limosilactobacillus caecicola]